MLYLDTLLDIIAYSDPASGKQGDAQIKKTRARQAIVVVGQDQIGRVFTLEAWAGRVPTAEYVDQLIAIHQKWHPQRFGIEANAMQILFAETVQMIVESRGLVIPFEPVYQPTNVKKEWRNRTRLQPLTAHGRLFIQEMQLELRAELLGHPNYPTVDLVDALATACSMLPQRQRDNKRLDDDMQALAQYLRDTGAPASYIKQRIAELRQERIDHLLTVTSPLASTS
jgi:hypothetical protein